MTFYPKDMMSKSFTWEIMDGGGSDNDDDWSINWSCPLVPYEGGAAWVNDGGVAYRLLEYDDLDWVKAVWSKLLPYAVAVDWVNAIWSCPYVDAGCGTWTGVGTGTGVGAILRAAPYGFSIIWTLEMYSIWKKWSKRGINISNKYSSVCFSNN